MVEKLLSMYNRELIAQMMGNNAGWWCSFDNLQAVSFDENDGVWGDVKQHCVYIVRVDAIWHASTYMP